MSMGDHDPGASGRWRLVWAWAGFGGLAALALWMLPEHAAHVRQYAPFLLILACPLMHLFMHHEHHGSPPPSGRPGESA